jgi:hypothetical protein
VFVTEREREKKGERGRAEKSGVDRKEERERGIHIYTKEENSAKIVSRILYSES